MIQAGAMRAGLDLTTKFGPRLWKGIQNIAKGITGWFGKSKDVATKAPGWLGSKSKDAAVGGVKWMWGNKGKIALGGTAAYYAGWLDWLFDGDEELATAVANAKTDEEAAGLLLAKVGKEQQLETELSKPGNKELIFNMAAAKNTEEINKLLLNEAKRQDELNAAQHKKALHQQMTPLQTLFTDPDLESKFTPSALEGLRDKLKVEDKIRNEYDNVHTHGAFNKLEATEQADMRKRWFLNNTGTYGNREADPKTGELTGPYSKRPFTSRDIGEAYREGPPTLDTPTSTSKATSQPRARRSRRNILVSPLDDPTPRPIAGQTDEDKRLVEGEFGQIREPLSTGEEATEPGEEFGWRDLLNVPRELGARMLEGEAALKEQSEQQLKTLGDTLGGWRDDFKQWMTSDEQDEPALSPRAQRLLELQQRQQNTRQISPYLERGLREIRDVGVENMAD